MDKLAGKARQSTVEAAEKLIREMEDAEEKSGELWFLSVEIEPIIPFDLYSVGTEMTQRERRLKASYLCTFSTQQLS